MEIDTFIILVFVAAFMGGIVAALLGWVSTNECFVARKFVTSVIKALIGAVVISVTFNFAGTTNLIMLMIAFLSGAGVDAGAKRITNAITNVPETPCQPETVPKINSVPPPPPPPASSNPGISVRVG